jgi:hypothetical protein
MKLDCQQTRIRIIPENDIEKAYLESVFNLYHDGDFIIAKRVNAMDLNCWAFLEIVPRVENDTLLREKV